tara:strand:+ start:249 stop:464 length:216 start_codon:yes stop_codon:yes gene_type:complete
MNQFTIGQTYTCRSIGDRDCVFTITVASRTKATIKNTEGKTFRINKGMSEMRGAESIFPMGRYSMAPIISA